MNFRRHVVAQQTKKVEQKKELPGEMEFAIRIDADRELFMYEQEEIKNTGGEPIPKKNSGGEPIPKKKLSQKDFTEKARKKNRKAREDNKDFLDTGLVGKNPVCNDFRAIVKKSGKQINVELTKMLHDYNVANYNL